MNWPSAVRNGGDKGRLVDLVEGAIVYRSFRCRYRHRHRHYHSLEAI